MKTGAEQLDVTSEELVALLEGARAFLGETGYQKLHAAIRTLGYVTELLETRQATLDKLRRLLCHSSTEKTKTVLKQAGIETDEKKHKPPDTAKSKVPGHGRNGAAAYRGARKVEVSHASLKSGDQCPDCRRGKVYPQREPGVLVRIQGQAPIAATVYELEKLRCNLCGDVFTAAAPEEAGERKYDETAASMIALLRYGSGFPWNRLEGLQENLGIPLPAATQCEIVKETAAQIQPAMDELIRQAAQGEVMHNDDTSMRVLSLDGEAASDADLAAERTGVFTSGIVSIGEGHRIGLYFTGRKHAGENLTDVLKQRAAGLEAPIQMCDALSRNLPKKLEVIIGHCLAHYLDSWIIQSECEMDAPGRDGSGVIGTLTPDKASQAFEKREQFRRWPPFSRRRGVESRPPPECLQHVALHLKIGRDVSACGGHGCMAEVISNHRNIDPCLQKGNGTTVSHDVWSYSALS
jgi:transposase